ncbi:hypothetical protein QK290_07275 [Pseudarthrobacter sp. AL07]|uniref:hypothetical protein n=1 Tax=unclassified Pseudarthrobacter TaxID=2647000 RepID=UPI00249C6FA5|nr:MULTISPECIES: hypothetical protein [unclassified Pseudarthrobacter]MDI3194253.1 hypothetical protein [Pseudarthrobacter sp. AL20]MDI3208320.1 hypothetical protein [Pseudarthrobacter sp. AL07]
MADTSFNTTAVGQEAERSIRSIYLDRRTTAKLTREPWTVHVYRKAIDQSPLKASVKKTLHGMVDGAGNRHTTVDRATLCLRNGTTRVATITEHWHKARDAGLLTSKERWNDSSIHTLRIPGTYFPDDEDVYGDPMDGWHIWSSEEIAWWEALDDGSWVLPPWRDGRHRPSF